MTAGSPVAFGRDELLLDARFVRESSSRKMKRISCTVICALNFLAFSFGSPTAGSAGTNQSDIKLTVELHDGSRVVGQSAEQHFRFHSELFGDLKLAVKDVREVECVSSNTARLVTASGDILTAH
ncbi:MAG TPA: hypothetical protein VN836_01925 [Verrucomicrobiae bacterium]|nr:hypothetical protein [Verrucomicrobiae bacterium]